MPTASALALLRRTGLLDGPAEESFDRIARLAAETVGAPTAMIGLIDERRHFIKSAVGLAGPHAAAREIPHRQSLCLKVVEAGAPLRIDDARRAPLFCAHPAVTEVGVGAYLGAPLILPEGEAIGSLCVIDTRPRRWSDRQAGLLADLAAVTVREIGLKRQLAAARELERTVGRKDEHLGVLLAHIGHGLCFFDREARLVYANRGFAEICRVPPDAFTPGMTLAAVFRRRAEAGSLAEGEPAVLADERTRFVRESPSGAAIETLRDGRTLRMSHRGTPDGGWVASMEDITEELAAAEQARRRDERYRLLADNSSDVIILGHSNGRRSYYSPSVERLTGYAPKEALAIPMREWVHPDDIEGLFRITGALSAANPTATAEHRLKRRDGSYVWVEGAFAYVAKAGREPYVIATIRDVSRRKALETEYRNLFEHSIVGIYRRDLDGRLQRANPALAHMRGFAGEAELLAADRRGVGGWKMAPKARDERMRRLLADGRFSDLHFEVTRLSDGAKRWVAETAWLVRDATGAPAYVEGTVADVTERVESEAALRRIAAFDALSGCLNRPSFRARLDEAIAAGRGTPIAVLYVDLDRFKAINDSYGHAAGDALICQVARRLDRELGGAALARLGGDEFAVMLDASRNAAERMAIRIIGALGHPFALEGGNVANIGASVGIAVLDGSAADGGADGEELLRRADLAMFQAKRDGRNAYRVHTAALDAALHEKRRIEQGLRSALALDQLRLAFQPIFDLQRGRQTGYEALLRWDAGAGPAVSAGTLIPIAEETGLIVPIGEWVIDEALRHLARWPRHLRAAVNVSVHQLRDPGFIGCLGEAIARHGLDPRRVEIEVTESVLLDDSPATLGALRRLQDLGVRVALDDFGTGWSSLNYLNRHRFDRIKIDQSFIRRLDDRRSLAIVHAVLELGRKLGIEVTAEGIETEDQRRLLAELGCQEGQGYLLGRPMRAEEEILPPLAADRAA